MHIRRGQFWWPWRCANAIQSVLPDAAQHDQGFTRSHQTPPLGDYSLRIIAPVAARARQFYTARIARWRRFVAFIKATKCRHLASTRSDRHQSDMTTPISGVYFIVKLLKKSLSCPNNNRGVTHQTDEKHLNNMSEHFVGVVNIGFNRYNNSFLWRVINQWSP